MCEGGLWNITDRIGKMHERRECVATALCGVTDGDSERQTELSERGEEDILLLQTPAPRHDSGMSAMPCPSSLGYSHQEKHGAFDSIWRDF